MMSRYVLDLRFLAGVLAFLFAATKAQARQVELVQFGAAVDDIVIYVGRSPTRAPKVPAVSDEAPADLDALRQDFAAMVPPASSRPAAIA